MQATHRPHVVLTSNRTRELSDALKGAVCTTGLVIRMQSRQEIVRQRLPQVEAELARQTVQCIQSLRNSH